MTHVIYTNYKPPLKKKNCRLGLQVTGILPFQHYFYTFLKPKTFKSKRVTIFIMNSDKFSKKRYRDPDAAARAAEQAAQARAERIQQLNKSDQLSKRRKLVLPSPEVQDEEIEKIVKYGSRGEKMKQLYTGPDENDANNFQVSEYKDNLSDQEKENSDHEDASELLRRKLQNLPKPLNNFEIMLPEEEEEQEQKIQDLDRDGDSNMVEDEGEKEIGIKKLKKEELKKRFESRSEALVKDLPRILPTYLNHLQPLAGNKQENLKILDVIKQQIISDAKEYPIPEYSSVKTDGSLMPILSYEMRQKALSLVEQEVKKNENCDTIIGDLSKKLSDLYTPITELKDKIALKNHCVRQLEKMSSESSEIQERLQKTMGGYLKRQEILGSKMSDAFKALTNLQTDSAKFTESFNAAKMALDMRVRFLQEDVDYLVSLEQWGQDLYKDYQSELISLENGS